VIKWFRKITKRGFLLFIILNFRLPGSSFGFRVWDAIWHPFFYFLFVPAASTKFHDNEDDQRNNADDEYDAGPHASFENAFNG
jgi:hypothetical protein